MADKKKPAGMTDAEWAMSGEGNLGVSPELLGYTGPLPRPRPKKKKPALDTEGMAALSEKASKKANGGMIDRAAIRGKTKGKIC